VFSAVASGVDVHIPRSSALPLRPVMTLGPAPTVSAPTATATAVKAPEKVADRTMVVKVDPKPAQPGRPDPRFANGKARKEQGTPEIEKKAQKPVTPAAREAVKAPEKVEKPAEKPPEKMVAAKPVEPPAPKSPARTADKPRESTLPAPMASPYTPPDLGLPSLSLDTSGGFWGRLPIAGKLGLVATVIGLILGVMFTIKSAAGTSAASGPQVVSSPLADDGQWLLDWGTEPGVRRTHDIYIRKSSLTLSDYRVEFQEQMENRALGWVYRARDSKNYYVCRLEVVKPGAEPGVALVRYAVVNGEEQPRTQIPLTFSPPVHLDTIYKIRFEALGSHFTTWAQDQKIDDWTDDRFKVGGVGLFNEHGAKPVTLNLSLLVIKK
jgi:outer membrane biosynthesis protein TonB